MESYDHELPVPDYNIVLVVFNHIGGASLYAYWIAELDVLEEEAILLDSLPDKLHGPFSSQSNAMQFAVELLSLYNKS